MSITRVIPPITNQDASKFGQAIQYGSYLAISDIFNNFVLLSGGPAGVRTSVTTINVDEKWFLIKVGGGGGTVNYGDIVALAMPDHSNILLSGGPAGVRTNTTTINTDEKWQICGLLNDKTGQPVNYGDLVAFSMPDYGGILLSGGPAGVRTNTTTANVDESWLIVAC